MLYQFTRPAVVLDSFILICATLLLITNFPKELIFVDSPATGGDTGSHFWPLKLLIDYGPLSGNFRIWNPGNLLGEPSLVHYFPLPFYLMYLLSFFVGENVAFNLGTALPIIFFPLAIYWSMIKLNCRRPIPILCALGSLIVIFNGAYSAWGGNLRSDLAGQFSHQYALIFLFMCMGRYSEELRMGTKHYWSALLAFATCLSHAYVTLCLPLALIMLSYLQPNRTFFNLTKSLMTIGLISLGLSIWWLWPMLDNNKWVTPYADSWLKNLKMSEYIPLRIWIVGCLFLFLFPILSLTTKHSRIMFRELRLYFIFFVLTLFYLGMVFAFPIMGLVDIRAMPQIYLFGVICMMICLGFIIKSLRSKSLHALLITATAAVVFYSSLEERKLTKNWTSWNYSGWKVKPLYPQIKQTSELLKGDFSDPRVMYEHNAQFNDSGTMRVFEMTPYFMGRSTLESLYLQATLMARPVYYLQALVSDKPSCPIPGNECPRPDLKTAEKYFDLLAIKDIILSSEVTKQQASEATYLKKTGEFGYISVFENQNPLSYVVPVKHLQLSSFQSWRKDFVAWFNNYDTNASILIPDYKLRPETKKKLFSGENNWAREDCRITTKVDINSIIFDTACAGVPHLLKFSYHDSWQATDGSEILMASPGMMVIFPNSPHVELKFGKKTSWLMSSIISIIMFSLLFYLLIRTYIDKRSLLIRRIEYLKIS